MGPQLESLIAQDVGDGSAPEPGTPPVPGRICVLDGGVPWVRVKSELVREMDRLAAVMREILDGPAGRREDELDGAEQRVMGIWAAAEWTLGADDRSPMHRRHQLVSGQAIIDELAVAEPRMIDRAGGWQYALGVIDWLMWITGARETIAYPGFAVGKPAE